MVGLQMANVFRKDVYDGDCLCSEEMERSAVQRICLVCDACAHGGFNLANIISYSRTVLGIATPLLLVGKKML